MISHRECREALALTQEQFAVICGTTQAAIVAYEKGRRTPEGRAAATYQTLRSLPGMAVVEVDLGRGKIARWPGERWQPVVHRGDRLALPRRLDWSPAQSPTWDTSDSETRRALYARVLAEGEVADIVAYVDPDELAEMWPDVPVPRAIAPRVAALLGAVGAAA